LPVSGCTALQAVRNLGKVGVGTKVLIVGASGGVGHFALQIAKADGATVTAVCRVLAIVGGEGGNAWTGGFLERMVSASHTLALFGSEVGRSQRKVNAPDLLALTELGEAGKLKPVLSRTYRLEQAVEALKELENGHARGKSAVVIA
jgi:NADPH:quinone reductase-like Zn-dependent oxidoreductase